MTRSELIQYILAKFPDAYQSRKVAVSEPEYCGDELGGCRPHFSKEEVAFIARLRKIESEQPKVKARSFMEFSNRIVKVDSSNESRACCLRGHAAFRVKHHWLQSN